jgi:hypothetical protein
MMRDGGVSEKVRLTKSPLKPMMRLEVTQFTGWIEGVEVRGWISRFRSGFESVENHCVLIFMLVVGLSGSPAEGRARGGTLPCF